MPRPDKEPKHQKKRHPSALSGLRAVVVICAVILMGVIFFTVMQG